MKLSFAKVFAFTLLITTISFLNGEENEEPTLFVDSINLQVMTDLTIPGKDDPLTIANKNFYSAPFSPENLSFSLPGASLPQESITLFLPESSFPEKKITFYFPESSFPEEDIMLPALESPLPEEDPALSSVELSPLEDSIMPPSTESSFPEDAGEAVKAIYHFLLEDAPSGQYSPSAINSLLSQITNLLIEAGYYGIAVTIDPDQIDMQTGDDFREEGDTSLNLQIWIGEVVSQRTVAKGQRIKEGNLINHRYHKSIIENSPFASGSELNVSGEFLIDKPKLDNYLERLNRFRNRQVYVAVSSAGEPGKLVLDYTVNEPKPWIGYLQVSNTGTESTGEWRQRIGGVHYQLTGNDDVLSADYFTAEFDTANAVLVSYDFPLVKPDYLILRSYASYSDFAAANLTIPNNPDAIGITTTYGAELKYTPFYFWEHAVSMNIGLKYEDIEAENANGTSDGFARFLSPYLRLVLSKRKKEHQSIFSAQLETNLKDNDQNEFGNLGRQFVTDEYTMYSLSLYQSFFVEPLLSGYRPDQPGNWRAKSLVHEFALSLRGQYLTNDTVRLIPQKQYYAGGFFSVRGYNESAARGDTGVIGSVEYRIHLARLLKPYSLLEDVNPGGPVGNNTTQNRFNFRAPSIYGLPDWNFMVRGFVDWAKLSVNEALSTEIEQDLLSFGVGLEFQYLSNLNIRLDFGIVADDLETGNPFDPVEDDGDQGDSRFHLLATYSF